MAEEKVTLTPEAEEKLKAEGIFLTDEEKEQLLALAPKLPKEGPIDDKTLEAISGGVSPKVKKALKIAGGIVLGAGAIVLGAKMLKKDTPRYASDLEGHGPGYEPEEGALPGLFDE